MQKYDKITLLLIINELNLSIRDISYLNLYINTIYLFIHLISNINLNKLKLKKLSRL